MVSEGFGRTETILPKGSADSAPWLRGVEMPFAAASGASGTSGSASLGSHASAKKAARDVIFEAQILVVSTNSDALSY